MDKWQTRFAELEVLVAKAVINKTQFFAKEP
jgi:hypothetical protein